RVPLAVLGPVASRQRPEAGLSKAPLLWCCHFWAPVPSLVPPAVPARRSTSGSVGGAADARWGVKQAWGYRLWGSKGLRFYRCRLIYLLLSSRRDLTRVARTRQGPGPISSRGLDQLRC